MHMQVERTQEEVALVALLYRVDGAPAVADIRRSLEDGRTPLEILTDSSAALFGIEADSSLELAAEDMREWSAGGITLLTPYSDDYPDQLRSVYDYPLAHFARGRVKNDRLSAAIVGSRQVSEDGLAFASELASYLAEDGITVVSGLARGVDGSAHRAALKAGGRTVAVLGNGLDQVYPAEHRALQNEIAETGLLVSQFRPKTRPTRQSFPQRNITMSAYSSITVIAEAAEASGTRIQAHAAVRHARPLVISAQVVRDTSWGAEYASGPYDVFVASDAREARSAVREILTRSTSAANWLRRG